MKKEEYKKPVLLVLAMQVNNGLICQSIGNNDKLKEDEEYELY